MHHHTTAFPLDPQPQPCKQLGIFRLDRLPPSRQHGYRVFLENVGEGDEGEYLYFFEMYFFFIESGAERRAWSI